MKSFARQSPAGLVTAVVLAWMALGVGPVGAQPAPTHQKQPVGPADYPWRSLSPGRQRALQPLEHEWGSIDPTRRIKWIEIADRFPTLSPDEQARVQTKMTQWAQLSPEDRGRARLLFQQAKEVSPSDRGSKWEAYQSLSDEERKQLAERGAAATARTQPPSRAQRAASDASSAAQPLPGSVPASASLRSANKSNLVPNPAFAAPPMPVAPTVVQAGPGATTSLMSRRAEPPSHQQTGLPKITATPGFVDQTTLQPRRGPQAAATRSATASAPVPRP